MAISTDIARKLIVGGQWTTVNKLLTALSALVLNILIARLLPPEEVGGYYLIASIASTGMLISLLGTPKGVIRLLSAALASDDIRLPRKALNSCLIIAAFGILTVSLCYYLFIGEYFGEEFFESKIVVSSVLLTALWIAARAIQMLQAHIFRAFHRIDLASTFEGTVTGLVLTILLAVAWFLHYELTIFDVLWLTLTALTIAIIVGLVFSVRLYLGTAKSSGVASTEALKICLPLLIASISLQGMNELHVWLLASNSSAEQVALFGTASRLSQFVIIPLVVINSVIPPMVAHLYHQKRYAEMESVLRATATIAGIPSIVVVALLGIGAEFFLGLLFGEFYSKGENVLIILMLAQLINSLAGSPGILLSMSNGQNFVMVSGLISGVIGLAISLIFIPVFQATGAAAGLGAGLVIHNILMWCYCAFKLKILTHMRMTSLEELINFSRLIKSK